MWDPVPLPLVYPWRHSSRLWSIVFEMWLQNIIDTIWQISRSHSQGEAKTWTCTLYSATWPLRFIIRNFTEGSPKACWFNFVSKQLPQFLLPISPCHFLIFNTTCVCTASNMSVIIAFNFIRISDLCCFLDVWELEAAMRRSLKLYNNLKFERSLSQLNSSFWEPEVFPNLPKWA